MTRRLFTAGLCHESNSFSPLPTGLKNFRRDLLWRPGDPPFTHPDLSIGPQWAARGLSQRGWVIVEGTVANAAPSAPLDRGAYESLRDEILGQLEEALPVDAVALSLHGAMLAEGYDDCEGDLLERVRERVGPGVAVGAELDLHCHLSAAMLGSADLLIAFKEYPHIDYTERGEELITWLVATVAGEVRPTTALHDCHQIDLYHTPIEPMRSFVDRIVALESEPGVVSISVGHGFPWGDTPDLGTKLWVITDNDAPLAERLAGELGRELESLRGRCTPAHLRLPEAIAAVQHAPSGPVVLADTADNSGGGAASDSTFVARALLEAELHDACIGPLWDPGAVAVCCDAGVGARLDLRIGGKIGPQSGPPLDLHVEVIGITEHAQQTFAGDPSSLGTVVGVRTDAGMAFMLNDQRTQAFGPDLFSVVGIDPTRYRAVVVKSMQHFYAGFAPIASAVIYLENPGTMTMAFTDLPFEKRPPGLWPFAD